MVDAFALAFDLIHLHLRLIKMDLIGIKCESNANQMRLYYSCFILCIVLVGFVWNKSQEDQYQTIFAGSENQSALKDRSKYMCEWLSCLDC